MATGGSASGLSPLAFFERCLPFLDLRLSASSRLTFSTSWPSARASAIAVRRRTGSSPAAAIAAEALAVGSADEEEAAA